MTGNHDPSSLNFQTERTYEKLWQAVCKGDLDQSSAMGDPRVDTVSG